MSVEQFLGLYNYWIVIFLMMTGFYIVIARNNLIKTVIGLNIFQISVILLYVSMGKISGGTAPIVPPALVSHGHSDVSHGAHGHGDHGSDHGSHEHATAAHDGHDESHGHSDDQHHEAEAKPLHDDHSSDHSNDGENDDSNEHAAHEDKGHIDDSDNASNDGHSDSDSGSGHAKVIYSNPLPSVLMLTAIVVGIATTALALALIVRIREDYGTIEEDEILELDRVS